MSPSTTTPGRLTSWSTTTPGRLTSSSTTTPGRLTSWSTTMNDRMSFFRTVDVLVNHNPRTVDLLVNHNERQDVVLPEKEGNYEELNPPSVTPDNWSCFCHSNLAGRGNYACRFLEQDLLKYLWQLFCGAPYNG